MAADAEPTDDSTSNEAFALGQINWVGEQLDRMLNKPDNVAWARPHVRTAQLEELAGLRKHDGLPDVHVVVCGNTGAGKSTLLNALLGETNVLPTNGMRACTACLIELAYDEDGAGGGSDAPLYRAEVTFILRDPNLTPGPMMT